MLFGQTPILRPERARGALLSAAAHVTLGLIAVAVARYQPAGVVSAEDAVRPPAQMVWVPTDAPAVGGGGQGGGEGGEMGDVGPPGNGVSWPRLIRDVRPAYTADAMRARITGSVGLSCVVDRDGSVRDCRLTRSLDRRHGLDEAALRAARQWKFLPARRSDEPVPVRVTIDMDFSLR